jgi:hypothetical protein
LNLFDFNHPFFKPLWIRVLTVAVAAGWGVFEFVSGSPFWGVLFCGAAAMAAHGLFVTFKPRQLEREEPKEKRAHPTHVRHSTTVPPKAPDSSTSE